MSAFNRLVRVAVLATAVLAVLFSWPQVIPAQEHPEHPTKEHPEHPKDKASTEMTTEALAKAITGYIDEDSMLKGGYFLVYDTVDKKPLQLELLKVHDDKLASLGKGAYFACTDMKAADGSIYDLDFFMQQTEHGIETTEIAVHKKAGKARYGWKEEEGIWKKVKN
jgi:hypothetical protein